MTSFVNPKTHPVSRELMAKLVTMVRAYHDDVWSALGAVGVLETVRPRCTPSQWKRLKLESTRCTGIKARRRARITGTIVSVYDSKAQGLEDDVGCEWSVVCEDHSTIVCFSTLRAAIDCMPAPHSFCDGCRALLAAKEKTT